jgi:hypothetical protein
MRANTTNASGFLREDIAMTPTQTLTIALALLVAIPAARGQDTKDEKGCVYGDLTYSIGAIICIPRSNIALRCVPGGSPRQGEVRPSMPYWDSGVAGWPAEQPGQRMCFTPRAQ